jgi:hypothetical protein
MTKANPKTKFAVCISNDKCDDLAIWKLYQVLPDETAAAENYLRVVDESGEDYLYPENRFAIVEFPAVVEKKLMSVTKSVA